MDGEIRVNPKNGSYPVLVGSGLNYGKLALGLKKPCGVVLVSDSTVFPLYGEAAARSFRASGYNVDTYVIKSGEASKNLETVAGLLGFLADKKLTRGDVLAALGGGVVGDITGFVSAIYLRGIPFLQLPTTLLAAVDSSVGGKTGVDLDAGKNLVGAFHQPAAVFCDVNTFKTLPPQVYSDGMAEVIKHGMIADAGLLSGLEVFPIEEVCRRNVAIKARIVERDEFDTGERRLLNFGHTVGHAAELLSGYSITHGCAVAIGMAVMTRAAVRLGMAGEACLEALLRALGRYALPARCEYSAKALAGAALSDKKRMGGEIALVIPREAGRAEILELPVGELEGFIQKGLEDEPCE